MTLVQTPPKKIYMWVDEPITEYIQFRVNTASNGYLYVPLCGHNHTYSGYYATYNWRVSVDGGEFVTKSGSTSSSGSSIIFIGYTAGSHLITIIPVTEEYGWALAYGWDSSGISNLLTEVIYDGSYMGYAVSATDTGNYFRYGQYQSCTNLVTAPDEYLPDTVTTIGAAFRSGQYQSCSSLLAAPEEALPSSVTSIGQSFRQNQYFYCSALNEVKGWKDLSIGSGYYRNGQYEGCSTNKTVKAIGNVGYSAYDGSLYNQYVTSVSVPSAYLNNYKNSSNNPRVNITDSKFVGY